MTQKDLKAYIESHYSDTLKTVSEISKPDNGDVPLVDSEVQIYCFDDICKKLHRLDRMPTSADGLRFNRRTIELIEFKSGFNDKITKENFDPELAYCDHKNGVCDESFKQYTRIRKLEKRGLIDSLLLKAVETYAVLEHKIFPDCNDYQGKQRRLKLIIVIDAEPTATEEAMLTTVAEKPFRKGSIYTKIEDAHARFRLSDDPHYYDEIEVISAKEFKCRIETK